MSSQGDRNVYLINVGEFNVFVRPAARAYHLLGDDAASRAALAAFLDGGEVDYDALPRDWYAYSADEEWTDFDGRTHRIGAGMDEDALIGLFTLKKHNFGALVALREADTGRVRVFKPAKLGLA
jgi:hypothetical protein